MTSSQSMLNLQNFDVYHEQDFVRQNFCTHIQSIPALNNIKWHDIQLTKSTKFKAQQNLVALTVYHTDWFNAADI